MTRSTPHSRARRCRDVSRVAYRLDVPCHCGDHCSWNGRVARTHIRRHIRLVNSHAGRCGWRGRGSRARRAALAPGANVPTLNDDPIPGVSTADVLSAPLAFVAASVYVRLRGVAEGASEGLAVAPALAADVALVVNIVTI